MPIIINESYLTFELLLYTTYKLRRSVKIKPSFRRFNVALICAITANEFKRIGFKFASECDTITW